MVEVLDIGSPAPEHKEPKPRAERLERNRLIVHLARVFSRRYDIQVLPSRQEGLWATGFDDKTNKELQAYIEGERITLNDLPPDSFVPKKILYDEESAQEMEMDEINNLLHHEAGHAKYTDFRSMFEGQKQAKDEGHLPTSYWLTWEGIEDPRVNNLEGEESPAIQRQIRTGHEKTIKERLEKGNFSQNPLMYQFAYNALHYWVHGKGIPELEGTDVARVTEQARPLLDQYFQNTDPEQRKILQKQIWDIAKVLEKTDIEDEKKRQMAQKMGKQQGQQQGQPQGGPGEGQSQEGQGQGSPAIPGGKGERPEGSQEQKGKPSRSQKKFLERLKKAIFGDRKEDATGEKGDQSGKNKDESKKEKIDLSKLSEEDLGEIQDAINSLSPEERAELEKKARETIDEAQKEALEKELLKTLKLEKNKQTGEYEVRPRIADEETTQKAEENYQDVLKKVEEEEKEEWEKEEEERRRQEELFKQQDKDRREKIEMQKAGFDENEREKFLLYQALEDAMYSYVRRFKQAIEKVIPRKKEGVYEGGYFSGPKIDRRDLIRKAPLGDEQFHMRQVERPIGEPRLFIGLLVDNSGSMGGKKQENARKTMIFFAKVCKDMGIPFMAGSFGSGAKVIKEFRQDFDNPAERIKPKIIDSTNANEASTNMYAGIKVTIEAMNEQRRRLKDSHGLVFVITDGGANAGLTGDALRSYIEENRGRLTFKGFGLSGSEGERSAIQNYLNNYFGEGNCAYPVGFEDLPDEAFRLLRVNLMQFKRFLS